MTDHGFSLRPVSMLLVQRVSQLGGTFPLGDVYVGENSGIACSEKLFMIYCDYKTMSGWIFTITGWLFSHTTPVFKHLIKGIFA